MDVRVHVAYDRARNRAKGLAHRLFEERIAAKDASRGAPSPEELRSLGDAALAAGARRATSIPTSGVVVEERVTMKCHIPPCEVFGRNHLCPPYSPTATEFAAYLANYEVGMLVQVQDRLPEGFKDLVRETDDEWYCQLFREKEWERAYAGTMMPLWHRLHLAIMAVESAAQQLGLSGAVGLAGSDCGLCSIEGYAERRVLHQVGLGPPAGDAEASVFTPCDVSEPCPFPEVARPAMEAVGIDVVRTLRNAGWELRFPATSYLDEGVAQWTGLVLLA
jgi:predicted metal-binding protein